MLQLYFPQIIRLGLEYGTEIISSYPGYWRDRLLNGVMSNWKGLLFASLSDLNMASLHSAQLTSPAGLCLGTGPLPWNSLTSGKKLPFKLLFPSCESKDATIQSITDADTLVSKYELGHAVQNMESWWRDPFCSSQGMVDIGSSSKTYFPGWIGNCHHRRW